MIEQLTQPILQIIGTSIIGALTLMLLILNKKVANWFLDNIWSRIMSTNSHKLEYKNISKITEIREKLLELRVLVDSDRACLFQFHNGSTFTTKEPMWKISCRSETVSDGTSYISDLIKDVQVSSIIETIHVFWPDEKPCRGIEIISPEYCEDCKVKCKKDARRIIFIDVEKLEDGYSRNLLIRQGVKYVIDVPFYNKNGDIMGFVTTNYNRDMNIEEVKQTSYDVCKKTMEIEFMLMEIL